MDAIQKKSLELLQEYFNTHSKNDVKKEIQSISKLNIEGVTFEEYINSFSKNYTFDFEQNTVVNNSEWVSVFTSLLTETIYETNQKPIIYYSKKEELLTSYNEDPEYILAA